MELTLTYVTPSKATTVKEDDIEKIIQRGKIKRKIGKERKKRNFKLR